MTEPVTSTAGDTVIERTVEATPAEIWTLWTDPEEFRYWYGPAGAVIPVVRFDLRAGGERVVAMTVQAPGGERTMWFRGTHLEVETDRVLVYTETMTDEDGNAHSEDTTVRVELGDLGDGRTLLRLTHFGVAADSPGAAGWKMALDALALRIAGG